MSVVWWWCSNTRLHDTSKTQIQGPVSLTFFARNSNSMETLPCHNAVAGHQIATNFCTCHDSTAVVPCAKFCSDHCIRIEVRVKRNFHRKFELQWKKRYWNGTQSHIQDLDKVLSIKEYTEMLCFNNLSFPLIDIDFAKPECLFFIALLAPAKL